MGGSETTRRGRADTPAARRMSSPVELALVGSVMSHMRMLPLAALVLSTVVSACGSQPGITVSVGPQSIPMVLSSTSRMTGWWAGEVGDMALGEIPLTTVRTSVPVTLRFEAGQSASAIRGWLYDKDAPTPSGGPIEEFTLQGRTGAYAPRTIAVGRTYEVMVNVMWSGLLVRGEETHVFRLKIEGP